MKQTTVPALKNARSASAAALARIDAAVIRAAFDAESIRRERRAPIYKLSPPEPGDTIVVTAAGGTLATGPLLDAVLIYSNPVESV